MQMPEFSRTDLKRCKQQLVAWRRGQRGRHRIADEVWEAATELARVHGAGRVSRTLHLDYYKLRERLSPRQSKGHGATFVEVTWPSAPTVVAGTGGGCTVELLDGSARRVRMELNGDAATLVALAQAFWKGQG